MPIEIVRWPLLDHIRPWLPWAAELPSDRVEIHHDKANVASGGVPRALGFTRVREEQREAKTPQQTGVAVIWRVTREEWLAANPT